MNTILLQPTDVLFFRDGRPMEASLAGHGAAWPLPSVISAALLAALHRAEMENVHQHRLVTRGEAGERARKFGSLLTAGPFPVKADPEPVWFFPRPRDLDDATLSPAFQPAAGEWKLGSLPAPLKYATANRLPPTKDKKVPQWLSRRDYEAYLRGETREKIISLNDSDFFDVEQSVGIAIDPNTGTTGQGDAAGKIYSAHYLRLRETYRLGVVAAAMDKIDNQPDRRQDLLRMLLEKDGCVLVGGQRRSCTARITPANGRLPLPVGLTKGFDRHQPDPSAPAQHLVKWTLLSPAVWPAINEGTDRAGKPIQPHNGGWLPNWICPLAGAVLLKLRSGAVHRSGRVRKASTETPIRATLVAALVPKPEPVTGWALGGPEEDGPEARPAGAKSLHLAVPAGAVYYFAAESEADAQNLAAALNWHGAGPGDEIKNRRSTLMGEKGFGLGVCGTWNFFTNSANQRA